VMEEAMAAVDRGKAALAVAKEVARVEVTVVGRAAATVAARGVARAAARSAATVAAKEAAKAVETAAAEWVAARVAAVAVMGTCVCPCQPESLAETTTATTSRSIFE
jgi:hypothetical protein